MAKRPIKDGVPNIFDGDKGRSIEGDYPTDVSHEELFGSLVGMNLKTPINRKHVSVQYIPLDKVRPHSAQPRRAIPKSVRGSTPVNSETLPDLFADWLEAVNEKRETPLALDAHLKLHVTARADRLAEDEDPAEGVDMPPIEAALMKVVELAASIREQGLLNPITIAPAPDGNGYVIETGERRWLAYQLLRWHFGETEKTDKGELSWKEIPARVVEQLNVWHQAVENNVRDDLNAIGKARQLALLLMDIHKKKYDFEPLEAFEHEQKFYAQVADGQQFRIPRGSGEDFATALNLNSAKQVRDYRRLLNIEPELWDIADDESWTEGKIREAISDDSVPTGTVSQQNGEKSSDSVPPGTVSDTLEDLLKPIYSLETKYRKKLKDVIPEHRQAVIKELRSLVNTLKREIEQLENEGE